MAPTCVRMSTGLWSARYKVRVTCRSKQAIHALVFSRRTKSNDTWYCGCRPFVDDYAKATPAEDKALATAYTAANAGKTHFLTPLHVISPLTMPQSKTLALASPNQSVQRPQMRPAAGVTSVVATTVPDRP